MWDHSCCKFSTNVISPAVWSAVVNGIRCSELLFTIVVCCVDNDKVEQDGRPASICSVKFLFGHLFDAVCCTVMYTIRMFALHSALEALINFAYNGRIQIDTTNVQLLLVGSSFLHLQVVKDACCDFMRNRYVSLVVTAEPLHIAHGKSVPYFYAYKILIAVYSIAGHIRALTCAEDGMLNTCIIWCCLKCKLKISIGC